jgi:hypothetical protein
VGLAVIVSWEGGKGSGVDLFDQGLAVISGKKGKRGETEMTQRGWPTPTGLRFEIRQVQNQIGTESDRFRI